MVDTSTPVAEVGPGEPQEPPAGPGESHWGLSTVTGLVERTIRELNFQLPNDPPDFANMTDDQLREALARWGARQGYLETQIAYIESSRLAINRIMDAAVSQGMVAAERNSTTRRLKDSMMAEVIASDRRLVNLRQRAIEVDAQFVALCRLRDGLDVWWRTISRILSSRGAELGKL